MSGSRSHSLDFGHSSNQPRGFQSLTLMVRDSGLHTSHFSWGNNELQRRQGVKWSIERTSKRSWTSKKKKRVRRRRRRSGGAGGGGFHHFCCSHRAHPDSHGLTTVLKSESEPYQDKTETQKKSRWMWKEAAAQIRRNWKRLVRTRT